MYTEDIRWLQRFDNYKKAYKLLSTAFEGKEVSDFSELEQEGLIQRFEYTWELAWKTVKDFLEYSGIEISYPSGSRNVIKAAAPAFFETADIDGKVFIEMLETRNELSHIYDLEKAFAALRAIKKEYLNQLEKLYNFLKSKADENE